MDFRFFEIYRRGDYLWTLFEGALFSIALTVGAAIIGFLFALVLSGVRYGQIPYVRHLATSYVEFIRNTPLIVQLFFVAFGLPLLLGYQWPFWAHALLALVLNFSAYFSEILRAGYGTVPDGQREAAAALGMGNLLIFFKIVLPQAVAKMYPSLASQFIFLFLTTGVISEIGVNDLTQAGKFIDSRTFRTFEVFFTLTVLYIAISLSFKVILAGLQRRLFAWQVVR
ncbi:amino acid ABC transporter permease [Boseongicola aestuarii]|uniref:L-cystine transport system permease protein TcyL n=1 Tax=Boseongicola aestuarii TaxID=1470561 RepID=A0A238J6S5_9RHOB|nr:amino acid ABC transporter permease [Boseongicola aestuarii]SMX25835.1 L-cystine transport system permease protein TcyL [Boseongicola aestuarii]